jgi:hypothetical protein
VWERGAREGGGPDMRAHEGEGKGAPLGVPVWERGRVGNDQRRLAKGVLGGPTQEGQGCLAKGVQPQTVHWAWRSCPIAQPQHRGPHRCDSIYLLQC